jgi:hypothetical protein
MPGSGNNWGAIGPTISAWRSLGMPDKGIAGILYNLNEESGFNPSLRHSDQPHFSGEAAYAHGLYQEGGQEWNNYQNWLQNRNGADWRDPAMQSQFAAQNLKNNYPGVWNRMVSAGTPEEAAAAYASGYLKPAAQNLQSRMGKISRGIPALDSYGPASSMGQAADAASAAGMAQGAPQSAAGAPSGVPGSSAASGGWPAPAPAAAPSGDSGDDGLGMLAGADLGNTTPNLGMLAQRAMALAQPQLTPAAPLQPMAMPVPPGLLRARLQAAALGRSPGT